MRRLERNFLVVLLLASAVLSLSILTRGHLWWDDFASYIMQAQSLLDGSPRLFIEHNSFTIQNSSVPPGPVAYPWGFPALLAPALALFGLKVLALKLVNTAFFLAFLGAFYALARLRLPPAWSLSLVAILAFNPALLQAHDLILSDIPFLFFSTLSVLLIESGRERSTGTNAALTGLAIFVASTMRTNGLLLLVPLLGSQVLGFRESTGTRRDWRILVLPWLVFAVLFVLQSILLPNGQDSYWSHFSGLTVSSFFRNIWYYLRLPGDLFKDFPLFLGPVFLWLAGILFIFGLIANFRKNFAFLSYITATLALFIAWPETQGLRFIYPILPLMLIIAAEGVQAALERLSGKPAALVVRRIGSWAAALLIIISLVVSARLGWINLRAGREINGPFDSVSSDMFEFVREQTPSDSVIVFFKPRAMRLLSGRDSFLTQNCADLSKGDYVVIHEKQGGNGQIADVEACTGVSLSLVFNNQRFSIYKISP